MHFKIRSSRLAGLGLAAALGISATPAQASPTFVLSFLGGTSGAEQAAFTQAAAIWSSVLADNVTVNLTVGTAALGPSILASADSTQVLYSYTTTRAALVADATSSNDTIATFNLQAAPNLRLLINGTANNPYGSGSLTPYLDTAGDNTAYINMTRANAKALGLGAIGLADTLQASGCISCDGYIAFNTTSFNWDLDPSNGITAGLFDFVGIAVHEIGHALGFISGVDILDINSPGSRGPFIDDAFSFVSPLDLYRCTAASAANLALDWTIGSGTDPKMFSLNGCQTAALATFSTGRIHGDTRQASHWKDNLGLGAMDPTSAPGETISLTSLDLTAMDVIGWNLTPAVATPAPAAALVFAFGLAGLGLARKRGLASRA